MSTSDLSTCDLSTADDEDEAAASFLLHAPPSLRSALSFLLGTETHTTALLPLPPLLRPPHPFRSFSLPSSLRAQLLPTHPMKILGLNSGAGKKKVLFNRLNRATTSSVEAHMLIISMSKQQVPNISTAIAQKTSNLTESETRAATHATLAQFAFRALLNR